MKKLHIYVDASVVGGCEDIEFADDSLALWRRFILDIPEALKSSW